jgi:hypothetical protein
VGGFDELIMMLLLSVGDMWVSDLYKVVVIFKLI